ncbi:hypothetical protein B0I03_103141 [Flavobacterium aquaticum]|uniref:Signal transducing protein n=2 Tax=Flavobacteriaceae TaxID=49546 RepID=A0A327YTI8_9FLAO|nr:hypothetical protein B0I03_103141 [Flavobacterium aquaticum]
MNPFLFHHMENFITVAVFNYQHETLIIKNLLEQEGIAYFFENETIVGIDPFATIAYGGIKLKVHPNDEATVKEILKKLNEDDHLKIV